MMTIDPDDLREMGRIVAAHGVMGEMKVAPETDDPNRLLRLKTVLIGEDERSVSEFDILSARTQISKHGVTIILHVSGVFDRDQAEKMRQKRIFVRQEELPPLGPDEYYLSDLIGLDAISEDGSILGRVKDVLELPGQNVIVLDAVDGSEVMIPAVPEFLKEIDFDNNVLSVAVIEGML